MVFDDSEEGEEELRKYELRTEKWDVPVLATTQVQFLQALFDGKNTSVRPDAPALPVRCCSSTRCSPFR